MTEKGRETAEELAVLYPGRHSEAARERLEEIFERNPYMARIYPTRRSREVLEVFQIYQGEGEYFDLSQQPPFRQQFSFGGAAVHETGYRIRGEACIGCQGCRSNARRPEEIPPADPAVWMVIHGLRGAAGWAAGPFSFRYTVDSGGIPAPGAWLFYHAVRRGFNRKSQAIFSSFFHLGTSFLDCTSICRNVSRLPSGSLCVVQKCPPKAGSKTQKMAAPAPTKKSCPFGGRHQHLVLAFRDRLCYNT